MGNDTVSAGISFTPVDDFGNVLHNMWDATLRTGTQWFESQLPVWFGVNPGDNQADSGRTQPITQENPSAPVETISWKTIGIVFGIAVAGLLLVYVAKKVN